MQTTTDRTDWPPRRCDAMPEDLPAHYSLGHLSEMQRYSDDDPHATARGICTAVGIVTALALLVFGGPAVWHMIARVFA